MKKIEPEVAQALVNLRASQDFAAVLRWFEASLEDDKDSCVKYDGLQLYRAQGSALTLKEILAEYKTAPTTLNKFKSNPPKVNTL